jgi:hypothetical protein
MSHVKHPQDFWSGILFVSVGALALWLGQSYAFGTMTRMGPGFLPRVLAWGLVGIGLFLVARSFILRGQSINRSAVRPQIMIVIAIVAFALLIERVGLAPTVIVTGTLAALATAEMRWRETIPLVLFMAALCVLLFIKLLGQTMQPWTWSF